MLEAADKSPSGPARASTKLPNWRWTKTPPTAGKGSRPTEKLRATKAVQSPSGTGAKRPSK